MITNQSLGWCFLRVPNANNFMPWFAPFTAGWPGNGGFLSQVERRSCVEIFFSQGAKALVVARLSKAPKAKPDPDKPGEFLPNDAAAKAGWNCGILDASPSMLFRNPRGQSGRSSVAVCSGKHPKGEANAACGTLVKKELSARLHRCACGCLCRRDERAKERHFMPKSFDFFKHHHRLVALRS